MALGTALHSQVENYLLNGTAPLHESVQHLIERPNFPKRGDGLLVETPRNYNMGISVSGVPVRGRIDLVDPREAQNGTGPVKVWDWKTSSNFAYALTPDDLAADPQCAVYNQFVATKVPEANEFVFLHGYLATKGDPDSRIVSTEAIDRDAVASAFHDGLGPIVDKMKESFAHDNFHDVEPNWSACDAYGGCPYRKFCGSQPVESLFSTETNSTEVPMSVVAEDTIAARRKPRTSDAVRSPPGSARATGINPPDAAKPLPVTPYVPPTPAVLEKAASKVGEVMTPAASIAGALKQLEDAVSAMRLALAVMP